MAEGLETIEKPKLEWGPELGEMSWNDAQKKVEELNESLAEGEKKWRLPTKDELATEFRKTNSIPTGFQSSHYWSSTMYPGFRNSAYTIHMADGSMNHDEKEYKYTLVRLVRDAV